MKKARKKRIVRRKRRVSEKKILRLKRKLMKRARKLRLGAKRTGAYVYGTLRRIMGNPYTADQRRRIVEAINECNAYIRKESARRADLRPPAVQQHLDFCKAHKQKLLKMLGYDVAERYLKGNPGSRYRVGGGYKTFTLDEAKREAERIFRTTGNIVSIEEHRPTPQVAPAWKYGIYTGRGVVRKNPLEKMGVYAGRDGFEITDFKRGDRIQLHPGTDLWMRGAKYGQIIGIGRKKLKVKLDYLRRPIAVSPRNIGEIMYREIGENRRIRRNEEYARQIPRESRSMRARGFSKGFDFSAGSTYQDLLKFVSGGRGGGFSRKIGANTFVNRYGDGSIGVILYQTRILHYHPNGDVDVNFGGYMTPTTFSRINALIPYGWRLRKKGGKLALENSWGQRAVIRKPRAGEEYAVRLTEDKAYLIT